MRSCAIAARPSDDEIPPIPVVVGTDEHGEVR